MPRILPHVLCACLALGAASAARAENSLVVHGPEPLSLEDATQVPVTIHVDEPPATEGRPLQIAASAGTVDGLQRMGPGEYTATYHLPRSQAPQIAYVAFWFETGADAEVHFAEIPLAARTQVQHTAYPGAEVRVEVGGQRFGPVIAGRRGTVTVPIVAPPSGEMVIVVDGRRTPRPIRDTPFNRLMLLATPYLVSPEGGNVTIHAWYASDQPPPASALKLAVPAGEVRPIGADGKHYRFQWVLGGGVRERGLTVKGTVEGDPTASAEAKLGVGRAPPEQMAATFGGDGPEGARINLLVTDARGLGVPGLTISADPSAGQIARVADTGNGSYQALLLAPARRPADGRLWVVFKAPGAAAPVTTSIDVNVPEGRSGSVVAEARGPGGPKVFFASARVGGVLDNVITPLAGLEFALRPRGSDLDVYLAASFRMLSQSFVRQSTNVSSSLVRIPVTLGLRYDLVAREDLRLYGAAGAGVTILQRSNTEQFPEAALQHGVAPAVEASAGLGYAGAFLELGMLFTPVSTGGLPETSFTFGAAIGYRLGLF